jgi:hypothetical protein
MTLDEIKVAQVCEWCKLKVTEGEFTIYHDPARDKTELHHACCLFAYLKYEVRNTATVENIATGKPINIKKAFYEVMGDCPHQGVD